MTSFNVIKNSDVQSDKEMAFCAVSATEHAHVVHCDGLDLRSLLMFAVDKAFACAGPCR